MLEGCLRRWLSLGQAVAFKPPHHTPPKSHSMLVAAAGMLWNLVLQPF